MFNHDITVDYYRVREGTGLHSAIVSYHQKCAEFVQYAEALVVQHKAGCAVLSCGFLGFKISALGFTDKNAPLSWNIDGFGYFQPKENSEAAKGFSETLPYFRDFYKDTVSGLKFGVLGGIIVVSAEKNRDGSICNLRDGDLLDEASLEKLKATASKEQNEYFVQLSRSHWIPAPLDATKAFTPSEEIRKLNNERSNFNGSRNLVFKHSPIGRVLRRGLLHLGLGGA